MNLFFYLVNNNYMKKITLLFCLLLSVKVYAIENIKIDDNDLIPKFNKSTKVYNYFTNKDSVNIEVINSENETINGDGIIELKEMNNEVKIITSNSEKYIIHISKNYDKNHKEESYIKDIEILGYDINYDKNNHEYSININDEDHLIIDYELSNDSDNVSIIGNGNFNKTDNVIKIVLNNDIEYVIHAYKTINVSKQIVNKEVKEMSGIKKEIVKLIIITISSILVFCFYYMLFINKTKIHI